MRRGVALAGLLLFVPALAQPVDEARRELAATQDAGARAVDRSRRLRADAAEADTRVVRARRAVAELDRALAQSDSALAAARLRLVRARAASAASDAALTSARAPLAALVAALVRHERQPPSLLLATKPSLEESMRLRAALAAVTPTIDARARALRAAVGEADRRRQRAIAAVAQVAGEQRLRDRQRVALRQAVIEEAHQRDLALADAESAQQQADGLAEQAASLEALVRRLGERDGIGARLAALPGPDLRPGTVAAPTLARAYRMPARGRLLAGMGEPSATGVRTRGILLATAPNTIVRAPAAGRVAYAGAFRAWRAILILDHGHGWTTLVAGLSAVAQHAGTPIAQGDPIGRAGTRLLVELRHHGRPIDVAAMAQASS